MSRLDLFVLGSLSKQPMHGYKIIRYFEKRGIEMWARVKTPSVYKTLQRLEKQGFITGKMKQDGNNPPRKVFTLTKEGKKHFLELLNTFLWGKDKSHTPMDFWNAFRFVQKNITLTEFLEIIKNREDKHEQMEMKMKKRHKQAIEDGEMPEFPFYAKIMHGTMKKMKGLELETLKQIKEAAILPENKKDFKEEK
ncbi:MAG: PadR family transcriptional regulator [Candidatus Cloacimonetes bacterium]|nr:PadR family transcriptional regulator [Candidatus Cloacimonadota bacterium]